MPFLVLDTPAQAEGLAVGLVETTADPVEDLGSDETDEGDETVFPDVAQLAELASNFRAAQSQVVESQQDEDREAAAQAAAAELDAAIERSLLLGTQVAAELEAERVEAERVEAERVAAEQAAAEAAAEAERAAAEQAAAAEAQATAEAAAPASAPEAAAAPADTSGPVPPAQVNGRVPPPAGGPTAAQWDQVRNCESTHNYAAVNPSGKFRGAYQFSRQTWDWVAGVHHPHLVGVDPAAADPAWQDVMAYTLHEMSGPGQWPECGRFLN